MISFPITVGILVILAMVSGGIPTAKAAPSSIRRYQHLSVNSSVTQDEANAECVKRGGWLATVTSNVDLEQLKADLGTPTWPTAALLGGSDAGVEDLWIWKYGPRAGTVFYNDTSAAQADNAPPCLQELCNWNTGEPNNVGAGGENELFMWTSFKWNDGRDGESSADFVCEFASSTIEPTATREATKSSATKPTTISRSQTTLNYTYFYQAFHYPQGALAQEDAAQLCRDKGGYLGTIATLDDETKMRADLGGNATHWGMGHTTEILTGGHDGDVEGTWIWKYGPPGIQGTTIWVGRASGTCKQPYCHWRKNEPNDSNNYEDVLTIYPPKYNLEWNDKSDRWSGAKWYLCQFLGGPPHSNTSTLARTASKEITPTNGNAGSSSLQLEYKHFTSSSKLSHAAASALCVAKHGWLATITSDEDQAQLKKDVGDPPPWKGSSAIIGGKDHFKEGRWVWEYGPPGVQGTVFYAHTNLTGSSPGGEGDYTKGCQQSECFWSRNEPNNQADEDFLYIYSSFLWNDGHDGTNKNYLCQLPVAAQTAAPTPPTGVRYRFYNATTAQPQYQMNAECKKSGGWLATIPDKTAMDTLISDLASAGVKEWQGWGACTSGTDSDSEGTWRWKYGPSGVRGKTFWQGTRSGKCKQTFCDFRTGEPNDYGSGEDILAVRPKSKKYEWNDVQQSYCAQFICEFSSTNQSTGSFSGDDLAYTYRHYTHTEKVKQNEAAELCEEKGGFLATVTTRDQHNKLRADLADSPKWSTYGAFMGGADSGSEGVWKWKYGPPEIRGSTFFVGKGKSGTCSQPFCNWDGNEPNDHGNGEDEMGLRPEVNGFRWNDIYHGYTADFICQFYSEDMMYSSSNGGGGDGKAAAREHEFEFAGLRGSGAIVLLTVMVVGILVFILCVCVCCYTQGQAGERERREAEERQRRQDEAAARARTRSAFQTAQVVDDTEMSTVVGVAVTRHTQQPQPPTKYPAPPCYDDGYSADRPLGYGANDPQLAGHSARPPAYGQAPPYSEAPADQGRPPTYDRALGNRGDTEEAFDAIPTHDEHREQASRAVVVRDSMVDIQVVQDDAPM